MGIKGIYGEIGPGRRIALTKLAIEKFEQTGRPLRIAIDISIWQFQIQSGKGGTNPALRTLYYRLLRLLSLCIQPLFVFDGSQKPPFKRNKRTGPNTSSVPNLLTKQMLSHFGFPYHIAPGEAEAECALLQRNGIVDAVLSEDVDTLMFGCGLTLRNWSSEGSKGNHAPTHVSVYDVKDTKDGSSGLDREGMILVALMSGGDYITEGIPGCGVKVACEAARAGYGRSLCRLSKSDSAGLEAWRKDLAHELQTNELGHFRVKHKALKIPDRFPNKEVLSYYTHPVVSTDSRLDSLRKDIKWDEEVDVLALRTFASEAFDWTNKSGARKFIRNLAPALLVSRLRARGDRRASGYNDLVLTAMNEMELVRAICGKRNHFSTDGLTELRLIYCPADIVGLDLTTEPDDNESCSRDGLAPRDEEENFEPYHSGDEGSLTSRSASPTKKGPSNYDPSMPEKMWILETIAKVGVPLKVEDYEESLRNPLKAYKAKAGAKKAAAGGGMTKGALDRYLVVTKPISKTVDTPGSCKPTATQPVLLPVSLSTSLEALEATQSTAAYVRPRREHFKTLPEKNKSKSLTPTRKPVKSGSRGENENINPVNTITNPWTLSSSPSSPSIRTGFSVSKPGITRKSNLESSSLKPSSSYQTTISSSRPTKKFFKSASSSSPNSSPSSFQNNDHDSIFGHSASQSRTNTISSPVSRDLQQTSESTSRIDNDLPGQVHHNVKFVTELGQTISSSPNSELPSMESFLSQQQKLLKIPSPTDHEQLKKGRDHVIDISSSPSQPNELKSLAAPRQSQQRKGNGRRVVMLRDSLEGSWKEITEQDDDHITHEDSGKRSGFGKGRRRVWRGSEIEILDMTGG